MPYKNPEKESERQAKRRQDPKYQEYMKRYRIENREKLNALARKWYEKNLESQREYKKESQKKMRESRSVYHESCLRLGIPVEVVEIAEIEQQNKCAICGNPETAKHGSGKSKRLCVDHDHETNKFRGLLCTRCNKALGVVNDNVEILENMIDYIIKHKELVEA